MIKIGDVVVVKMKSNPVWGGVPVIVVETNTHYIVIKHPNPRLDLGGFIYSDFIQIRLPLLKILYG